MSGSASDRGTWVSADFYPGEISCLYLPALVELRAPSYPQHPTHYLLQPTPYPQYHPPSPIPSPHSASQFVPAAAKVSPSGGSVRRNGTTFKLIEDALVKIFRHLDMVELQRASSTSSVWRRVIDHNEDLRPKLPTHVTMSRNFIQLYKIEQLQHKGMVTACSMNASEVPPPFSSHRQLVLA